MDMAVAEEYIEYYADKYKTLIRTHKFAMPLCKHTDKNKLYNAIEITSNIPAGYYIRAECTRDDSDGSHQGWVNSLLGGKSCKPL